MRGDNDHSPARRSFLRATMASGAIMAWGDVAAASTDDPAKSLPGLIVRSRRPLDVETPVEAFKDYLTPNELFFVRHHFDAPAVGLLGDWQLQLTGLFKTPLTLSLADIESLNPVERPVVLQCAGNGRALFDPLVTGVKWERGAVGNAYWAGVRLADVLQRAGLDPAAKHIHMLAADRPPHTKTPAFFRSLPIERALDPSTILAIAMNGERIPVLHGGPLRVIVPGWTANHSIKWLKGLIASTEEAPGFYQRTGYRMPRKPVPPPGTDVKPEDLVPVAEMNVKSLIAHPSRKGAVHRDSSGHVEVKGVAWTGRGRVTTVEVSIDSGPWQPARFEGPDEEYSWRQWRFAWSAPPGKHSIRARATDSQGQTQPDRTPWNRSGYLWNGIDEVACEVV